jgi:CHAD domain-containing protein
MPARIETHLQEKLRAMFTYAPRVAATTDVEALHKMRVASRRLRVGLRYFEDLFPPDELKQVQRQLRRLTKALGRIRNIDRNSQLMRQAAKRLPVSTCAVQRYLIGELVARRAAEVGGLSELLAALRTSHFEARIQMLILKPRPREDKRLVKDAKAVLDGLRRDVRRRYKKCRRDKTPTPAFHKLRLAAKRYRYGIETSQEVFQINAATRLRAVEELQDHLGACQDMIELVKFQQESKRALVKIDKNLADPLQTVVAFFEAAEKLAFARFQKFLGEDRLWLKKVKWQ